MLFKLLTYLQPIHYFQVYDQQGQSVFPIVDGLPEDLKLFLKPNSNYVSFHAKAYDLSWQAIQMGYIGDAPTYTSFEQLPIVDEYRFIRTYFHPVWVFYVFIIRLFSLCNPIKEFKGWFTTRSVKRNVNLDSPIPYKHWPDFKSQLINSNPKISVIIPTLNRYPYLKAILHDLEQQDYPHFEVLVVDQSDDYQPDFYKEFNLDIRLIRQEAKALWLARNTAIRLSQGELIALSEDDVRVGRDWISTHLKCLDFFGAQVSAGVFYPEGQTLPKSRSFFAKASQFATGNAMLYKTVFQNVGLFDRQFEKQRMGDGEFGMRLYLNGIKSISNPYASCVDVKASTGGLRDMGSWDAFRPSTFFAPRPIPSVLYYYRTYFGNTRSRLALLRTVPSSILPYKYKKNKPLLILGVLGTILLIPIVLFQVYESWRLSSKKLQEGPLIEPLSL